MDQLSIPDHYEWWVTYDNKREDLHSQRCATAFNEDEARKLLQLFREEAKDGVVYECQRILVQRTAEKLDW